MRKTRSTPAPDD
jgi:hypothetical protein